MKLSEYAKKHNIQYRAAWNRFKAGKIPNAKMIDGRVVIEEESPFNTKNVIIYARVSSSENKTNLEAQAERLCQYATAKGYTIVKVVKEVGSGVNDNRKQLQALLSSDEDWAIVIVEHKDRLTRFGFNYISTLMTKMGRFVEVVNQAEDKSTDLMQDLISVIYSFSAKMYGMRRSKRKTEQIIELLNREESDGEKEVECQSLFDAEWNQ